VQGSRRVVPADDVVAMETVTLLLDLVAATRRAGTGPTRLKASSGAASGVVRFNIVIQKMRQLRMQRMAIKFTSRSAVLSFACSAWHPDLRIL